MGHQVDCSEPVSDFPPLFPDLVSGENQPVMPSRESMYSKLDKIIALQTELVKVMKQLNDGLAREVVEIRHCVQAIERNR